MTEVTPEDLPSAATDSFDANIGPSLINGTEGTTGSGSVEEKVGEEEGRYQANAWRATEQGSGEEVSVAPKLEAQSSSQGREVEEVGWGAFGEQGRCGSFSDFLAGSSSLSEDSNSVLSNVNDDFFRFTKTSTSGAGSNVFEQQDDDAAFFDLASSREEQAHPAEAIPNISGLVFEPLSGGHSVSAQSIELEKQAHKSRLDQQQEKFVSSQSQGKQVNGNEIDGGQRNASQADGIVEDSSRFGQHGESSWQELEEYPGWVYNTLTGEWFEKGRREGQEVAGSLAVQDQVDQVNHWQSSVGTLYTTPEVSSNAPMQDGQFVGSFPANEPAGDHSITGKAHITAHGSLGEASRQQIESGQENSTLGSAGNHWENQYPGWYYDYHAQEWKQEAQSTNVVPNAQALAGEFHSSSTGSSSYGQATSMAVSQMSNGGGWSSVQGQYSADQSFQDAGSHSNFGQNDYRSGVMQDSYGISSTTQGPAAFWQDTHNTPYDYSSYQQTGQQLSSGGIQDPGLSQYTQDSMFQLNHNPHNQSQPVFQGQNCSHSAPGYETHPWLPARMSNDSRPSSHYASQEPPKSSKEALGTSAGRPPHVLTTFGFGGKLVVMKLRDPSLVTGQTFFPGPIHIHNLYQVATQRTDNGYEDPRSRYFKALNQSLGSGPLVGGSVSSKELNKWLADRVSNCQSEEPGFRSPNTLPLLWGLLNLAYKHYGKLRSQGGLVGGRSQEEDSAEGALAKLLTSGSDQSSWTMGSFNSAVCLRPMPSEHEMQMSALEIKKLLVTGKPGEALRRAQQGQLWGLALVLARQLGEQNYADTAAEMARHQFLPGSPLRTLSLLLAGQPAEVFSGNNSLAAPLQTMQIPSSSASLIEDGLGSMLEEWQENLSIMASNRTNGDDRVISHLGDCLWKVNGEVAAAHICYLVADATFESFSSNARLCLIGADHWKNPRTYVTPESIQRTEVYEYSKVSGNPQFILVPFQPYKVVYAEMLAEVGKTSEALRYCQAVLKTLKTTSRLPELETCRLVATSLEERLRFSVQGGSAGNLAPVKLVKEFFRVMDRGISGIIGGPPLSTAHDSLQPVVAESVTSLQEQRPVTTFDATANRLAFPYGPSASAEKLNQPGMTMPQRSVSEPDFSATMKEKVEQGKPASRGGYLHRFGSVFSKAGGMISLVSKTNKNEAKLGDKNTFYYDEKLKRWVEEGGTAAQEEAALAPPPTTSNFVGKVEDPQTDGPLGVGLVSASSTSAVSSATRNVSHSGTPPVPPSNQFSARSRQQGVRSRYVDTFNKGGNSAAQPPKPVASFAPAPRVTGMPLQPTSFFVAGPSAGNFNSSVSYSEKDASHLESVEGFGLDGTSTAPGQLQESEHAPMRSFFQESAQSLEDQSMPGAATTIAGGSRNPGGGAIGEAVDGSVRKNKSPNGDTGFGGGLHTRANSWSGYTTSPFHTEIDSNHITPETKFNISSNGFLTENIPDTQAPVGSYFVSPSKNRIYPATNNSMLNDTVVAPPSASVWPPVKPVAIAAESRGGNDSDFLLTGDSLQEVEL